MYKYHERKLLAPITLMMLVSYNEPESKLIRTFDGETYNVGSKYFYCYLLKSTTTNRTYFGYTDNIAQRLRQHNGEIKGGAKATRYGRPWKLVVYIRGFLTKNEALSFEWYMHHPKSIYMSKANKSGLKYKSGYGVKQRILNMQMLLKYNIWRSKELNNEQIKKSRKSRKGEYIIKNTIMAAFWHIEDKFDCNMEQYYHYTLS